MASLGKPPKRIRKYGTKVRVSIEIVRAIITALALSERRRARKYSATRSRSTATKGAAVELSKITRVAVM